MNKVFKGGLSCRLISGLVAVLLVMTFVGCSKKGGGRASPAKDFVYELNKAGNGVVITGYLGRGGDLVIPSEIEGFPVVEFRADALSGFHEPLTRIILRALEQKTKKDKDDKEKISKYKAQIKKENIRPSITSIVFPDSITEMAATENRMGVDGHYISSGAFEGSFELKYVKFPKKLREIPPLFGGCDALTTIILPESVEIIGRNAFWGLNITSMKIPEGVKEISESAFQGCTKLKSAKIPESIEKIGSMAFRGCSELTTVDIPSHKILYGYDSVFIDSFQGCPKLTLAERKKIQDTGYTGEF